VKRKSARSPQERAKPSPTQDVNAATASILPMDIQIGDRFTDEEGEWEVVSHPATLHGAKRAYVRGSDGSNHQRRSVT
jgi:hypothetical protein